MPIRVARTFIIPSELPFCPSIVTILHYAATFVAQLIMRASPPSAETGTVEVKNLGVVTTLRLPRTLLNSTRARRCRWPSRANEHANIVPNVFQRVADHECWWRYQAHMVACCARNSLRMSAEAAEQSPQI